LRETKFAKFPGGACPQTPLEARAVGARLSAEGAKRASTFLLKRGWNVCLPCFIFIKLVTRGRHFYKSIPRLHPMGRHTCVCV